MKGLTAMKGLQHSHERLATRQPWKACKMAATSGLQDDSHWGLAISQKGLENESHARLDRAFFFTCRTCALSSQVPWNERDDIVGVDCMSDTGQQLWRQHHVRLAAFGPKSAIRLDAFALEGMQGHNWKEIVTASKMGPNFTAIPWAISSWQKDIVSFLHRSEGSAKRVTTRVTSVTCRLQCLLHLFWRSSFSLQKKRRLWSQRKSTKLLSKHLLVYTHFVFFQIGDVLSDSQDLFMLALDCPTIEQSSMQLQRVAQVENLMELFNEECVPLASLTKLEAFFSACVQLPAHRRTMNSGLQ